jgi:hypothetical protein
MAIRKLTDGVRGWNSKMPFPKDRYTLRCIEESFSPSKSSGNPMITREWEICAPELVVIGDKEVDIDGLKVQQYVVIDNIKDAEKGNKAFGRFSDELTVLGFDDEEGIDTEKPPLVAKGKVVDAIVYGKEDVSRKTPTKEQLKKGIKQGDPIKGPDGKDIKTYQLTIESILGLSTVEVNRPY